MGCCENRHPEESSHHHHQIRIDLGHWKIYTSIGVHSQTFPCISCKPYELGSKVPTVCPFWIIVSTIPSVKSQRWITNIIHNGRVAIATVSIIGSSEQPPSPVQNSLKPARSQFHSPRWKTVTFTRINRAYVSPVDKVHRFDRLHTHNKFPIPYLRPSLQHQLPYAN